MYINFVDYEKAFDSLDRDKLWKLLQHYRIPDQIYISNEKYVRRYGMQGHMQEHL